MRILMISDVYFPRINGVSTSIQTFRQELELQGHEVYLIVPEYPEPTEPEPRIIRIRSRGVFIDPEDRMMKYRDAVDLIEELRLHEFDIVHIHTPFVAHYAGVKIARRLGIPCVCTYHTLFEEYLYHYIPWLPQRFLKFCTRRFSVSQCRQVAGVISPSSLIVELLKRYGVRKKLIVLPTGIDAAKYEHGDGESFRRKHGLGPDKKVLLNVSRIAYEKNIGLLLQMFQKLLTQTENVHLLIAGEGPAKKDYLEQVAAMGLTEHVSFVGYLDRNTALIDCYHAADVFVFASVTETQGLVLLEAMAAGLPVVSVAEMGTKDVLKENLGARITDGSIEDFSGKVLDVLSDEDMHAALASSARRYAREWDAARLAEKMAYFYAEICGMAAPTFGRSLAHASADEVRL